MLLEVDCIDAFYGKSQVLRGLTFGVPRARVTALLGRNGMGKTTTLRAIMGLTPPRRGRVRLDGREITGLASHHVARLGVGYVPEGRQLFPHLDVGENLRLAGLSGRGGGRWTLEAIFQYFPILRERWRQRARSLSGGEQQMLAIARALCGNPVFMMLDEPSQGLAPLLVREVSGLERVPKDKLDWRRVSHEYILPGGRLKVPDGAGALVAALGRRLAGRKFALVLTSPLSRARETCRLAGYGEVAQVTDDLCEWDYGMYEGRTTADIRREEPGWSIWTSPVPGGESITQVGERARRVIERAAAAGGDVALFAHAHILRILAVSWIEQPPVNGRLFALETAAISVLGYERETRVIQVWNSTGFPA